jgi:2-polyprenyl-6-methoxyphenol hydroxylase-like FAD-dependent oxidoreductase
MMHQTTIARRKALIIGGGVAGPALALFLQRAGIEATIFEARSAAEEDAGFFLNLGPNGVNVLKVLGIDVQVEADGFPTLGMTFYNGRGRQIAEIDSRDDARRYGASGMILKRSRLHRALRDRRSDDAHAFPASRRDAAMVGRTSVPDL